MPDKFDVPSPVGLTHCGQKERELQLVGGGGAGIDWRRNVAHSQGVRAFDFLDRVPPRKQGRQLTVDLASESGLQRCVANRAQDRDHNVAGGGGQAAAAMDIGAAAIGGRRRNVGRRLLQRLVVGSHGLWRMTNALPAHLQNSHHDGGRVFLIFVADPRTIRLSHSNPHEGLPDSGIRSAQATAPSPSSPAA